MSARFCQTLVLAPTCAVARSEQPKARGRSQPERTRLYVMIGDDRERRDATLIAMALGGIREVLLSEEWIRRFDLGGDFPRDRFGAPLAACHRPLTPPVEVALYCCGRNLHGDDIDQLLKARREGKTNNLAV